MSATRMPAKIFVAQWYELDRCEAEARKAGWDGNDGFLDYAHPEEGMPDTRQFRSLNKAVEFLNVSIINERRDVFGQAEVVEIECDGPRCKYCTCRGKKPVRRYIVSGDGIDADEIINDCLDDE
jgi:hypothetical protein